MPEYLPEKALLPKAIIILFFILTSLSVCTAQALRTKYKITGYTLQKGKARLMLYVNKSQFIPYDSADIKNGTFTFSGTLDEPKSFQLLMGNKGRILFVGNENILVTDRNEKTGEITVTGSKLSNDYDYYFNRWIAPLMSRLQAIDKQFELLDATHQREADSLTSLQSSLFDHVPDSAAVFIRQKPSSFVSLYLLNYYSDVYSAETISDMYNRMDTGLKKYPSAVFILQKLQPGLQASIKAPSFSVTDQQGKSLTLSSFKGSYLLIGFWASWNTESLKNLPVIQKAAERFQHQNFKVLTASLDTDTSAWKTSITRYHLGENCKNVFLPNRFSNPMAIQFQLASVPRMILIDPEGNIIENNISGEKINSRLEKIFTVSAEGDDDVALL